MPVFGIVQDYPIVGIIVCTSSIIRDMTLTSDQDEVLLKSIPQSEVEPNFRNKRASTSAPRTPQKSKRQREPSPTQSHTYGVLLESIPQSKTVLDLWDKHAPTSAPRTPQKSKRQREPSPTQSHITEFFASSSKAKARESVSPPGPVVRELSLIDTKTRRSNSLPSDDDAFSSRMQLMLYHHLLSTLLSPTFSFSAFWEKVHVDPLAQLSDKFLLQSGLAHETDGNIVLGCAECLDDLADLWHLTVRSLQVEGVSPTLEIVYRTRTRSKRSAAGAAPEDFPSGKLDDFFGREADREARDIARAIEASQREYDSDLQRAIAESLRDVTPREDGVADGGDSVGDTQPRLQQQATESEQPSDMLQTRWHGRNVATESTQSEAAERDRPMGEWGRDELGTGTSKPQEPQTKTPGVIGRKSFAFDEAAMQAYVRDVLQWWRGERPPRGVDVEHSHRCL
jgi:exonuclease V